MLITTLKTLLEQEDLTCVIMKLLQSKSSKEIVYLTTQFPLEVNDQISFVYLDLAYVYPTYLCNLSDCYPNLDILIVKTTQINIDDLVHKYRITIFLCNDDVEMFLKHEESERQLTLVMKHNICCV